MSKTDKPCFRVIPVENLSAVIDYDRSLENIWDEYPNHPGMNAVSYNGELVEQIPSTRRRGVRRIEFVLVGVRHRVKKVGPAIDFMADKPFRPAEAEEIAAFGLQCLLKAVAANDPLCSVFAKKTLAGLGTFGFDDDGHQLFSVVSLTSKGNLRFGHHFVENGLNPNHIVLAVKKR